MSNGSGPCPKLVALHIGPNGQPDDPGKVTVFTDCQTIVFMCQPNDSAYANPPIVFADPPPSGYDRFKGTVTSIGSNQWRVDVNDPVPGGSTQRKKYKYDIVAADGKRLDPDVDNDPWPPPPPPPMDDDGDNDDQGSERPHGGQHRKDS